MTIHTDAVLIYGVPLPSSHDAYGPAGKELLTAILEHHPAVKTTTTGYNHEHQWLYTQYYTAGRDGHVRINQYVPADEYVALQAAMLELDLPAGEPHDPAWHLIGDEG